VMWLPLVYIWI